jgi:hypothetical protein
MGSSCWGAALSAVVGALAACGGSNSAGPPPRAAYVYVASQSLTGESPGVVYQYRIATNGMLTALTVPAVAAGAVPVSIIADPTGRFVYVANDGDGTISQYRVGVGGELVALSPAVVRVTDANYPGSFLLSVDPGAHFVYLVVTAPSAYAGFHWSTIAQFSIGTSGTLTPLNPAQVTADVYAHGPLSIQYGLSGKYAYLPGVGESSNQVAQFVVGDDGALSALPLASVAVAGELTAVAVAPDGQSAFVLSSCVGSACDGQVVPCIVSTQGILVPAAVPTVSLSYVFPGPLMFGAGGSSAYLVGTAQGADTLADQVFQYTIDSSGALEAYSPPSLSVASSSSAVDAKLLGADLFVVSSIQSFTSPPPGPGKGYVSHFIAQPDGQLATLNTTAIDGYPVGIALASANSGSN